MATVVTGGQLESIGAQWSPASGYAGGMLNLYGEYYADYAAIFRTQPAVRRVVGFLARNIAQLGLQVFRRVSDNDRERLAAHPLAQLIARPNDWTTRYRMIDTLICDLGIYDNGFWVKVPAATPAGLALVRIPPPRVTPLGSDWLRADGYRITGNRGVLDLDASQVMHFRGYNPDDARTGLSPLETLRRVLAEEQAMGAYREGLWRKGARFEMVLTRPVDAPKMSVDAKDRFWARWNAQYSGLQGSGSTALLEEGMDVKPMSFSAKDAQYLEARKLNTEEVAAAYHVPLPMVGILDHATFSNITEQHKQLYQDTLGPRLVDIEEEVELQLVADVPDSAGVYVEFNLSAKLRGSFEEQATQLQTSVGGPYLTRNEARARVNLPALPGGDELIVPLNVIIGGQASPTDSAPPKGRTGLFDGARLAIGDRGHKALAKAAATAPHVDAHRVAFAAHFADQQAAADGGDDLTGEEWDLALSDRLEPLAVALAADVGGKSAEDHGGSWDAARAATYLALGALYAAKNVNLTTAGQYATAADTGDTTGFWADTIETRSAVDAEARVDSVSQFAVHEGAKQAGAATKTWVTTSTRARPSHAALSGQTVGIDDTFGNGLRWPRDSESGDPAETAGCDCDLEFNMEDG